MTIKEDIEKYAESFLIIISQEDINSNKQKTGSFTYKNEGEQLEDKYGSESYDFAIIKNGNEITVIEEKKEENKKLVTTYKMNNENNHLYIKIMYNGSDEKYIDIEDANYTLETALLEWIKERIKEEIKGSQKVLRRTINNNI